MGGKEGWNESKAEVLPQNAFARKEVLRLLRLAVGRYRTATVTGQASSVAAKGVKEIEMQA